MTWVIAYDIGLNRRRARVSKLLAARGIRIQKSVFLVQSTQQQIRSLVHDLAAQIDPATDSVCGWPLSNNWQEKQLTFPREAAPFQEVFIIA